MEGFINHPPTASAEKRGDMANRWKGIVPAFKWIAANDEPGDTDIESIKCYISVALVADMTGNTVDDVARGVLYHREIMLREDS